MEWDWDKEKLDHLEQAIYFTQYLGEYFGSESGPLSHRRIWSLTGCGLYYGPPSGAWIHIGNAFLWLRDLDDLNDEEIRELYKTIYPKYKKSRRKFSIPSIKKKCKAVIYKTKHADMFEEDLYTIDVHLKMISLRMATTWYDGGKTKEKISIKELVKRGWIASRDQVKAYREYYEEDI